MRTRFLMLLLVAGSAAAAQVDLAPGFRVLYEQEQYDRITAYRPAAGEVFSARALYYVAMAWYRKEDDRQALRYFDAALRKGPADADMYYYKGMTLLYRKRAAEAAPVFADAIALRPDVPDYWAGKGEALIAQGANDSARWYFEKAAALPGSPARTWLRLGDLYNGLQQHDRAQEAYARAYGLERTGSTLWKQALYNLALTEYLTGRFAEARAHWETLLAAAPDDWGAKAKLLQSLYALGDYEKAAPLKAELYAAAREKKLPGELSGQFCFDQFRWQGRRVLAYERFDPGTDNLKVKWVFYVLDAEGKVGFRVQAESSPALEGKGGRYVLARVRDGRYATFWNFRFNDDVPYPRLKAAVLAILEGREEPGSGTPKGGQ